MLDAFLATLGVTAALTLLVLLAVAWNNASVARLHRRNQSQRSGSTAVATPGPPAVPEEER